MLNGLVEKCLTRRRYANKKTKKITNGFTKSYYEKTKEKKESEEIMPYHYGHGKDKKRKNKPKKSKMGKKKKR